MPRTTVRIDEQDRRGEHDIHEVEIGSSEDVGPEPSSPLPPPPHAAAAANVQTDPPPVRVSPPPIPPRQRINSITEGVGNDSVIEARHQLVIVDQFVQFRTEPGTTQICGVFEIANVTRSDIIIFKVKTTSLEKFHVGPTIGALKPHSTGRVTIKVLAGQTMDTIKNEGFLIQATVLPPQYHGALSSSESDSGDAPNRISRGDFQRLSEIWKEITDVRETYVEDHRMKARITVPDPRQIIPPLPSSPAAPPPSRESAPPSVVATTPESIGSNFEIQLPNQDDLRRRLTLVQDQVTVSSDTIEANLEWNTWLLYGLYALVFACTLFLYWSLRNPGNRGSVPDSSGSQEIPIPALTIPLPPSPSDTESQTPTPTPSNWRSCLGF